MSEIVVVITGATGPSGGGGGGGASALDDLTDVTITAAASGDILRHNGTAWVDAVGTTHFEVAGAAATAQAAAEATASAALSAHTGDTVDAHDASAISFVAGGTIAATDVQTAVAEVATDAASALSTHEADTTSVHGIADTSALLTTSSSVNALADVTITTPSSGQVLKYNGSAWVNDADATGGGGGALNDLTDVTITAAATGDIVRYDGAAWVDTPGTTHFEVAGAVATHEADTTNVHGIADTSALVTTARTISTTTPLSGGGALSGNLTLSVGAASDTASGVVELATTAETTTGTDTARAVTPAGLLNATTASNINARVAVKKAGTLTAARRGINFIEGSGVTITTTDDSGNEEVDVTIAASGSSSGPQGNRQRLQFYGVPNSIPIATGAASGSLTADMEYANQFMITAATNITEAGVEVTTSQVASTVRVAIRNDVDGVRDSVAWEAGTPLDSSSTGFKSTTGSPLVVLQPGVYWAVVKPNTTGVAIRSRAGGIPGHFMIATGDANNYHGLAAQGTSGALPTTPPAETSTTQLGHMLIFKWDQV